METRIISLLKKYIERTVSPEEVEEIKSFMQQSDRNSDIVHTFISLHKTEIQADFLSFINKDEAWNRVRMRMAARKRKRVAMWAAAVAASVIVILSATMIYFHQFDQTPTTLTAVMQADAQNRAVITLTDGEGIELDGKQASQLKDAHGNVVCENKNGKIVYYKPSPRPIYNKVCVMEGSTYKIALSDGTEITLASGSEIVYPIGGTKRDVKLKGEALFDVHHDDQRPFTVACANGTKVTVLGTKFNVSAQAGKPVAVTVESGKVGVTADGKTLFLTNGEHAVFGNGAEPQPQKVDAKLYTSWASGIYEFNDVPMSVIVNQLSLWYGVEFEFASPHVKERKFTGALLRDEKLGYTLGLLKEVSNLKFSMNGEKIVIE